MKTAINGDRLDLIFIGPPGSGKSAQMKNLARVLNHRFCLQVGSFSPGKSCRREMETGSCLGKRIQQFANNGILVPDEIIFELWNNSRADFQGSDVVFYDGYPRSLKQVQHLTTHAVVEHRRQVAIFLELPDQLCVQRLQGRKENRSDDGPEIIHRRLAMHRVTDQLLRPRLRDLFPCCHIDASRCLADVGRDIMRAIRPNLLRPQEVA